MINAGNKENLEGNISELSKLSYFRPSDISSDGFLEIILNPDEDNEIHDLLHSLFFIRNRFIRN